jgi:hypothetical protein
MPTTFFGALDDISTRTRNLSTAGGVARGGRSFVWLIDIARRLARLNLGKWHTRFLLVRTLLLHLFCLRNG